MFDSEMPEEPVSVTGGPLDMTVPQLIQHWAKMRADWPALIFRDANRVSTRTVITYQELYVLGSRFAALLLSRGVRRDDVVLIFLRNSPERAVVEAGLLLMGCYAVTGTCLLHDASDLLRLMKVHKVSAVVIDPDRMWSEFRLLRGMCSLFNRSTGATYSAKLPYFMLLLEVRRNPYPDVPTDERDFLYFLRHKCTEAHNICDKSYNHQRCSVLATPVQTTRPCLVHCTPQNPADPKQSSSLTKKKSEQALQVFHCGDSYCRGFSRVDQRQGFTCNSRLCSGAPMGHCGDRRCIKVPRDFPPFVEGMPPRLAVHTHKSMVAFSKLFMPRTDSPRPLCFNSHSFDTAQGHLSTSLCTPVTRILLDEFVLPPKTVIATTITAITREQCLVAVIPAHQALAMGDLFQKRKRKEESKLVFLSIVGEPSVDEVSAGLLMSEQVMISYPSAELLLPSLTIVSSAEGLEERLVGYPVTPWVMVRVVDEDDAVQCGTITGYLQIRSPLLFQGYLHDAEATKQCWTSDGFFRTRDAGYIKDGRVMVVTRFERMAYSSVLGSGTDQGDHRKSGPGQT